MNLLYLAHSYVTLSYPNALNFSFSAVTFDNVKLVLFQLITDLTVSYSTSFHHYLPFYLIESYFALSYPS